MKVTTYYTDQLTTVEQVEEVVKKGLKDKYEYKVNKKSESLAGKIIKGATVDNIVVIKNAYHRNVISINTMKDPRVTSGEVTTIVFSEATVAGWLAFLNKQVGIVGHLIIRLIYGKGDGFYEEVERVVKSNIKGREETVDVGLTAMFKKK